MSCGGQRRCGPDGIAVPAGTADEAVYAIDAVTRKSLANPENRKLLEQILLATRSMGSKEYTTIWAEFAKTVQAVLDATSK